VLEVRALGYRPLARELVVGGPAGDGAADVLELRLGRSRTLTPVTVIGAAAGAGRAHPGAADVLTSVSVLGAEQVARENVQFAQEVLRKVPGVYHANFNQGIISGDVGIRGFNTASDVASTKLLVDGIPTNLNSGLGEFNALFPLEIERIEIVRGTNDPRYGLFNLAGNVGVTTRGSEPPAGAGGPFVAARALTGSFGTQEAQGVVSRAHALGRGGARGTLAHTWFGGWRDAAGFRANSALEKRAGSGKVFWTSPARASASAPSRAAVARHRRAGVPHRAEARAAPGGSPPFADADGGSVDTRQASLHLVVRPTPTLAWSGRVYGQRFERVRYVRFSAAGAQQERVEDERQRGAITELTWSPAALAPVGGSVSAGADWQGQDNAQQRYRTAARAREATLRDYAFTFANGGGYARANATLGGRLTLDAGLRVDRVGGDFRNVQTGEALPVIAYGWIPQPKASASLAVSRRLSVYGNYGRGFQTGTGLAAYGRQALTYSRNDGYEAGAVLHPLAAWSLRAGAWRQDASGEVRLRFDNSGDSENVGRTERRGVDVETTVQLARGLAVWGALTTQRAVLAEPGARAPQLRGNRLNHVPDWTAKYGADWTPLPRVTASFWAYGQDGYHLTDANDLPRYGGYTAVNADVSVRLARGVGVGLAVQNLFDRYFEYVWLDGATTRHSPANPRSLFLTMRFDR
jgi:iron complex outermembrane receptor protein